MSDPPNGTKVASAHSQDTKGADSSAKSSTRGGAGIEATPASRDDPSTGLTGSRTTNGEKDLNSNDLNSATAAAIKAPDFAKSKPATGSNWNPFS